jgi:hypothetical protein
MSLTITFASEKERKLEGEKAYIIFFLFSLVNYVKRATAKEEDLFQKNLQSG